LAICDEQFLEYLYATLTSWGMHRMGKTNTKLTDYSRFCKSIQMQREQIARFDGMIINEIPFDEVRLVAEQIWNIIQKLEVGVGKTKLVAGSKTLHHILPDLVPPIDRQYTLQFFYGNKNIIDEVSKFIDIFACYHHIALTLKNPIQESLKAPGEMDTSITKVIDNTIVGYVLSHATSNSVPQKSSRYASERKDLPTLSSLKHMTHTEQIFRAACLIVTERNRIFSRNDVRQRLGISPEDWLNGYTAIFQGMRIDQPGGAPGVADLYQGVFKRVRRGEYQLTDYGESLRIRRGYDPQQ
jgi:hypothetical protein